MPENWQPLAEAFAEGLAFGLFVGLLCIAVLLGISTIRRLLNV